jgi:ABC-type Fe3+ transport system substrate-binding protein
MKFTPTEEIQLDEVRRRILEFKNGNKNAPMIFLGTITEVKTLVKKGVLIPYSKEVQRALNWYNLTDFGKQFI